VFRHQRRKVIGEETRFYLTDDRASFVDVPTAGISRANSADPYDKFLSAQLATMKAEIPDYAEIPHEAVVKRDLARRKPFQQSGKGYRDTLLWETILRHCISKKGFTAFVTQNTRDFASVENQLHKELIQDVHSAANGIAGKIVLTRDLLTFTDRYVVPYLADRKDFALLVQHNRVPGLDLNTECEHHLDSLAEAVNKSPFVMVDDASYEPEVDTIEIPADFKVKQASEVSQYVLLVAFEFVGFVSFTYFIPRIEFYTLPEERQSSIAILDPDWNESVMQVESSTLITFNCRLTFNTKTQTAESFEVESAESAV
jgi:PIN domain